MNLEELLLIIVLASTLLMFFLHQIFKKSKGGIANFINKIWDEWFEEQKNAILAGLFMIILMLIICVVFR